MMKTCQIAGWLIVLMIAACAPQQSVTPAATQAATATGSIKATETQPPPVTPTQGMIEMKGWFTIVWNGEPHYYIANDQQGTNQLLLDEKLMTAMGGPLALDRKEVMITGEMISTNPNVIRVLSIQFVNP